MRHYRLFYKNNIEGIQALKSNVFYNYDGLNHILNENFNSFICNYGHLHSNNKYNNNELQNIFNIIKVFLIDTNNFYFYKKKLNGIEYRLN